MSLDDIVNVSITRETAAVTRAGFGYGLILGTHAKTLNRVDWYNRSSWSTAMVADGYATTDAIYKAVQAYFSQSPCPTKVAVGRIQGDQIVVSIDAVQNTTHYIVKVECATPGTPTSHDYTSDSDATQTEIADGIAALIEAGAETDVVSASNVGDDVQIDLLTSAPMVVTLGTGGSSLMTVGDVAGTIEDVDDALAAIVLEDNTWYGLACVTRTQAQVELAAAWVESNKKLFVTASADANIPDTTDAADTTTIAAVIKAASYARSGVIYNALAASTYPDAAWLGACLPKRAGAITWAFKTLAGITADTLTATQRTNILAKYCNCYEEVAGVSITQFGLTGAGEYFDITRGVDALAADIQEDIYQRLVTVDKIPFTNKGISSLKALVKKSLEDRVGPPYNFIADGTIVVTAPDAADVDAADKAARTLPDLDFSATLAGAIHEITITGVVTV